MSEMFDLFHRKKVVVCKPDKDNIVKTEDKRIVMSLPQALKTARIIQKKIKEGAPFTEEEKKKWGLTDEKMRKIERMLGVGFEDELEG